MTEQQECRDLPSVSLPDGDMLENIFNSQLAFQTSLDANFENFAHNFSGISVMGLDLNTQKEWAEKMAYNILASHAEHTELLEWLPWKNWKTYSLIDKTSIEEARYEAIDILHFVLNMMMLLGMTPETIYDLFMRKQAENRNRQKRGY
jgi:hypothetical protein